MGFSFKVAPGVRIRASSRGLRASVGPRAARVHFGAGRPGLSTGFGPVTFYQSTGGGRARRGGGGGGPSRTSIAAYERRMRQAQKLEQAQDLLTAFEHILTIHRQEFAPASPPVAPEPDPLNEQEVRRRHEEEALRGIGWFKRSARAAARERAAAAASSEIRQKTATRERERAELQRQLDGQWQRLLANDPDVVTATLTEAFEDNEAFAAVVGVHGDEVAAVVLVPSFDIIPERMPKVTEAGNLSLPKLAMRERNDSYTLLVCGHVLVTIRETLAVAPAISWARVAAVRLTAPDAYGAQKVECLLAAVFRREALQGIRWDSADAAAIVNDASAERSLRQGRSGELLPLDLSAEPALAALIQSFDVEQLEPETGAAVEGRGQPSQPPPPWHPRSGWGTIREFVAVPDSHGETGIRCRFIPDDGGAPVELDLPDTAIPELGEYARGVMRSPDQLSLKVSSARMTDAERAFERINAMDPMKRALMYGQGGDIYEDCGWAWTSGYKLVKVAPGLIH